MYGITKVLYSAFTPAEDNGLRVIWWEAPGFRVDADEVERFPHFFNQFVDVEPFTGGYRDGVGDFVPGEEINKAM